MWAHRPWVGRHLPASTRPGEELAAYSRLCTTVEGNTTFYALPAPATVARWAELADPSFRFCFKLPRTVTHERRLRGAEDLVAGFCERLGPLGDLLGPTSIQLPPSFGPADLEVLASFCASLPGDWSWAVEVRHPGFADGGDHERALNELLWTHGFDRVLIDTRALFSASPVTAAEREAHERKPRLPVRPVATAERPLVRFIGLTDPAETRRWWAKWVPKVADWLADGREPHVFVHTPDNDDSPALARAFHTEVARLVPDLEPLPTPPPTASEPRLPLDGG